MSAVDALVVGGGPAGLSAALWLARYRARVLLVDAGEHRNRWVEQAHGYLGADPVHPGDLLARARQDLARYPEARRIEGRVDTIAPDGEGGFRASMEGEPLLARHVVLATGVADVFPEVGGFFDHYGASVFHCPTCDGYEAKGRQVVAFGWDAQLASFAATLLGWAASVDVVTNGRRFEGDAEERERLRANGVRLWEESATQLLGPRGALRGVRLGDGTTVECDLAFFSIEHRPTNDLAAALGCGLTDEGCVEVDAEGATTVPGVFAAGDLVPGLQLIQVAAAQGAVAGVGCAQALRRTGHLPGASE